MPPLNLKIERVKRGLTQYTLADELNVSRSYITAVETQREMPSANLASKLEKFFNKPIGYLLQQVEL